MNMDEQQLPPGWELAPIEEIARTATGGTPRRNRDEYYGGNIPWVKSGDLTDGVVTVAEEFITSEGLKNSNAKIFPKGAICIALYGATVGKLGVLDMDAATNQAVCGIFPHECIEPRYVFHSLRNLRTSLINQAQGGAQPNISNGIIKQTEIPVPPLPEQRRIVAKIGALQERSGRAAKALEEVGPLLEHFRQSILAAAFSGRLTADWRAKNPLSTEIGGEGQGEGERKGVEPAHELLARIRTERRQRWEQVELAKYEAKRKQPPKDWKDKYEEPEPVDETDLPGLPAGWCWACMDDVATLINGDRGKNYPNQAEYVPIGLPFINTGHIDPGGSLSLERMNYITRDKFDSLGSGKIQPNDLVYCLRGATLGKTAFVDPFMEGAIASSLVIIRPDDARLRNYLYQFLVSPLGRDEIFKYDNGSAQPNLSANSVTRYLLPIPPLVELDVLCNRLKAATERIASIEQELSISEGSLGELNQSILAKAFRGELVPQDPNDEPASELMARIQKEREASGDSVQGSGRKKKARGNGNASESARPEKRSKRSSKAASAATPDTSADASPEPARPQRRSRRSSSNNEDPSLVIRVLAEGGAVNIHADTSGPQVLFYTKSSGGGLMAEIEDIPEADLKPNESARAANLADLMESEMALLYPENIHPTYLPQLRAWYTSAVRQLPSHFDEDFLQDAKTRWSEALQIEESSTPSGSSRRRNSGRLFDA